MIYNISSCKSSILTKLVLIFLSAIIPVYILGLSIYNWGYAMVKKEISNSMISQVEFYLNTLESEINRMRSLQYECINDENLLYLANASQIMNNYEKTHAMLLVQKRLSTMKNSSAYIQNVSVHIPSVEKTITAIKGVENLSGEWDEVSSELVDSGDASIMYWKNKMHLKTQYPNNLLQKKTRKPLFTLEIELSDSELKNRLLMFTKYKNSGTFLVNDKQEYELMSSPEDSSAKEIQSKISQDKSLGTVGTMSVRVSSGEYQIAYKKSQYLGLQMVAYIPKNQIFAPIKKYQILFVFFTIVAVIIMFFFFVSTNTLIHKPLKKLVYSFRQLEKGDLSMRIEHKHIDEFQYLYKSFNVMVENLSELIEQVYKQKILAQRSELKYLQSQINPHFLYNSFYILYRMAKDEDYENIVTFSQHLAEYYRFITRNAAAEVLLMREVAHAKTYLEIQEMRFYNRVEIKFGDLPEKYKELYVPRLIIQPIIENVFEHGIKNNSGKGIVFVEFNELENGLCISVEDNGSNISDLELEQLKMALCNDEENIESTGIINIHRRLQLRFGHGSGIVVSRSRLGGLKAEIRIIPKEEGIDCIDF